MIQAQNPEEIKNIQVPSNTTVTKVHGFGTPTTVPNPNNSDSSNPQVNQQTETPTAHSEGINKVAEIKNTLEENIYHWWHKIALILLTVHGLLGLFESFKFIFVEYPELSHLLELHQVEAVEANHLLAKAIITLVVTFVNVLFAIRLSKVKETTAHNIDLIVATFLIISTQFIQNFLYQLDLINLFLSSFS